MNDLIGAHSLRIVELNSEVRYPECDGCDWVGAFVKDHAEHVNEVVAARIEELEVAVARVLALASEWEFGAGPDSRAWAVLGPQKVSVPFAVRSIRDAVEGGH